jgi:hypothetical protein
MMTTCCWTTTCVMIDDGARCVLSAECLLVVRGRVRVCVVASARRGCVDVSGVDTSARLAHFGSCLHRRIVCSPRGPRLSRLSRPVSFSLSLSLPLPPPLPLLRSLPPLPPSPFSLSAPPLSLASQYPADDGWWWWIVSGIPSASGRAWRPQPPREHRQHGRRWCVRLVFFCGFFFFLLLLLLVVVFLPQPGSRRWQHQQRRRRWRRKHQPAVAPPRRQQWQLGLSRCSRGWWWRGRGRGHGRQLRRR